MRQSSWIIRAALILALAGAATITPRAFAQDDSDIVVHGGGGSRGGGADPNERVTRHVSVSMRDLNLHSDADVAMLRQRVRDAATSACDQVKQEIPTMSADAYNDCVEEAHRDGMREANRAITRARG